MRGCNAKVGQQWRRSIHLLISVLPKLIDWLASIVGRASVYTRGLPRHFRCRRNSDGDQCGHAGSDQRVVFILRTFPWLLQEWGVGKGKQSYCIPPGTFTVYRSHTVGHLVNTYTRVTLIFCFHFQHFVMVSTTTIKLRQNL